MTANDDGTPAATPTGSKQKASASQQRLFGTIDNPRSPSLADFGFRATYTRSKTRSNARIAAARARFDESVQQFRLSLARDRARFERDSVRRRYQLNARRAATFARHTAANTQLRLRIAQRFPSPPASTRTLYQHCAHMAAAKAQQTLSHAPASLTLASISNNGPAQLSDNDASQISVNDPTELSDGTAQLDDDTALVLDDAAALILDDDPAFVSDTADALRLDTIFDDDATIFDDDATIFDDDATSILDNLDDDAVFALDDAAAPTLSDDAALVKINHLFTTSATILDAALEDFHTMSTHDLPPAPPASQQPILKRTTSGLIHTWHGIPPTPPVSQQPILKCTVPEQADSSHDAPSPYEGVTIRLMSGFPYNRGRRTFPFDRGRNMPMKMQTDHPHPRTIPSQVPSQTPQAQPIGPTARLSFPFDHGRHVPMAGMMDHRRPHKTPRQVQRQACSAPPSRHLSSLQHTGPTARLSFPFDRGRTMPMTILMDHPRPCKTSTHVTVPTPILYLVTSPVDVSPTGLHTTYRPVSAPFDSRSAHLLYGYAFPFDRGRPILSISVLFCLVPDVSVFLSWLLRLYRFGFISPFGFFSSPLGAVSFLWFLTASKCGGGVGVTCRDVTTLA